MALADEINRMIKKIVDGMLITSSGGDSPKTNRVIDTGDEESPDLEGMIKDGTDSSNIKEERKTGETLKKVERWDKGHIGKINSFSSTQMGNLTGFVENPAGFIIGKVFSKFARGVGVIAFALIIFEAVKFIIRELLKPGRLLDLRFKRSIQNEIIAFRRREDQQKLRQGFSNIIITSMPRLRGSVNQAAQTLNTLDMAAGRVRTPDNLGFSGTELLGSGVSFTKHKGGNNGRRFS